MKKYLLLIPIIYTVSACTDRDALPPLDSPKLKPKKTQMDNGYEKISYYADTLKHGKYERYDSMDKLEREGYYYNDAMTGRWVFYDTVGKLQEVRYYHQNELSGPDSLYYPSGNLKRTGFYSSGKEQGPWVYYYPDGSVKSQITFVDGLPRKDSYQKYDSITKQ